MYVIQFYAIRLSGYCPISQREATSLNVIYDLKSMKEIEKKKQFD